MPSQITGVVICDFLLQFLRDFQPSFINQLAKVLGDVHYFEVHFKFGILIFKSVKAVRGRNHDFPYPVFDKGLDVFPGQAFE